LVAITFIAANTSESRRPVTLMGINSRGLFVWGDYYDADTLEANAFSLYRIADANL